MGMLDLSGGYAFHEKSGDNEVGANLGVGFNMAGISVNVSYTDFGVFDSVMRFGVAYTL